MTGSSTGDSNNELCSPAAVHTPTAAAAASVKCEGVEFTVTERNEVAEVARGCGGGAAPRVLDSESFFDAGTGTRRHFVDVQGKAEAMLFLVSVREDQRRIVAVSRCC
jgi:hypothetical protein